MTKYILCILALALVPTSNGTAQVANNPGTESSTAPDQLKKSELGNTRNVHTCGKFLCTAGQFERSDIPSIKAAGFQRVISLRADGEIQWDEKSALEEEEIEFIAVPFRGPETLTDEIFDEVRRLLKEKKEKPTLFHCGSANRVGGVWLPYRVLDEGVKLETALEEAKQIGLRNEGYEAKAIDYIRRQQAEKQDGKTSRDGERSVKPGINDRFLDPNLEAVDFVKRFEIESREVFSARMEVLKAINLKPGDRVADIGAGTGLYTRLFSTAVGSNGWVFAVDISPRLVEHINIQNTSSAINNVTAVLCDEDSINLPPQSVDAAFICDTYHHFEFPKSTLSSIYRALKPGGQLILIDFERIPGKSRPWLLDHVRGGKEVFQNEVLSAGFEMVDEVAIAQFEENYFLKFRRK